MNYIFFIYKKFVYLLCLPIILGDFLHPNTGKEYGINLPTKILLVFKMYRNTLVIKSASGFIEHLFMASKLFIIPKSLGGCVVECGSFMGGSTANLSLACALCKRKLFVFDSFSGLPKPSMADAKHVLLEAQELHTYKMGDWKGSYEEVKQNVKKFGNVNVSTFAKGLFADTLPKFKQTPVFIFLDVDLAESLKDCIKNLWPKLKKSGYLFTHEAQHQEIAEVFYDNIWWKRNLKTIPPCLIGAGNGLGLVPTSSGFKSDLAYTRKDVSISKFKKSPQTGI